MCSKMKLRLSYRPNHAYTLIDIMVASALFSIATAMVMTAFVFCLRGFIAMSNYAILDTENRQAMDTLSKEIRQAIRVDSFDSTSPQKLQIYTLDYSGAPTHVLYSFDSVHKIMRRTENGISKIMLTNCEVLFFTNYSPLTAPATFDIYPTPNNDIPDTKVIELTWKTKRSIGGTALYNTENIQTARVVMRNQTFHSSN
jgi:hypothetical protein